MKTHGAKIFWLLNIACAPTYLLSVLWHEPGIVFNIIGGVAALVQCFALIYLIKDAGLIKTANRLVKLLMNISFASVAVKIILQLFSAWPSIAILAYQQRNLVIAYLHLVLLGSISLFIIAWIFRSYRILISSTAKTGMIIFLIAFVCTEVLLIAWPVSSLLNFSFTHYSFLMLLFSSLLPVGIGLFAWRFITKRKFSLATI